MFQAYVTLLLRLFFLKQIQIPYGITYMWNLKYDTNEPICETETESRT